MLLQDLITEHKTEKPTEVLVESPDQIREKIKNAKTELEKLRVGVVAQGMDGVMKARQDRLKNLIKALEHDLESELTHSSKEESIRASDKQIAAVKAAEKPADKKDRLGKAISAGHKQAAQHRVDASGEQNWGNLASKVHAYVVKASNEGKDKVTAEDIAHQFDMPARTINKWLERSEFDKTARLLGRR